MEADNGSRGAVSRAATFMRGLPRDWVVTASRTSIHRLVYQMVLPYLSIYTLALGATASELGLVNCLGMAAAALLSPFTGAIVDRIGPKRVYLTGIALLGLSWLIYGLARTWPAAIVAMILYYIGFRTSGHSCSVICGNSLSSDKRATGMSVCESLAAGLLGIVGPIVGAFVVTRSGGMNAAGIRPLFFICLAGTAASFALVLFALSNCSWSQGSAPSRGLLSGFREVFSHGRCLRRLIAISVVSQLPQGMIIPFTQPFAASRGASAVVLGAMVTGFAVTPLVAGIPIGRLADRIGKKRTLFMITPVFWLSCILLVLAKDNLSFVLAGVLQGSFFVCGVIAAAFQYEFIEPAYMGRWLGILGFFQMSVSAVVAFAAGLVWDRLGAQYIFFIPIALDLLVRFPLLATIREPGRGRATG